MEETGLTKKKKNTFKFQGFNEHKERIKLALLRNQLFPIQLESDGETKCAAALEKWTDLNATSEYVAFRREVEVFVQSLEILVLHKNDVIATFKEALDKSTVDSLQPIMEFGVALCLDLTEAMIPEFGSLIDIYTGLLHRHSAGSSHQALEHVFTGISYTMYALRRQLRRQPELAANQLKPLLLAGGHVTELAAESFAFLLRKLPLQSQQLTNRLLDLLASWLKSSVSEDSMNDHHLADNATLTEAVSAAVFYWLRGASNQLAVGQFQSVYPRLLDWLENDDKSMVLLHCLVLIHARLLKHLKCKDIVDSKLDDHAEPIRRQLIDRILKSHSTFNGTAELVARLLLGELDSEQSDSKSSKNVRLAEQFQRTLLIGRDGQKNLERWCRCVEQLLVDRQTSMLSESITRLTAGLTRFCCFANQDDAEDFCRRLFISYQSAAPDADGWLKQFQFVSLAHNDAAVVLSDRSKLFLKFAMPMLAKAALLGLASSNWTALECLGSFCLNPTSGCRLADAETFQPVPTDEQLLNWAECRAEEHLINQFNTLIDNLPDNDLLCYRLALSCSFLPFSKFSSNASACLATLSDKLISLIKRQLGQTKTSNLTMEQCHALFRVIYALLHLIPNSANNQLLLALLNCLLEALPSNCQSSLYWKCIDFILSNLTDSQLLLEVVTKESTIETLALESLSSPSHCVRLHSLQFLKRLLACRVDYNKVEEDKDYLLQTLRCLENCITAESLPVGIENLRDCLRYLDCIDAERMAKPPNNYISSLCCRYLLGLLRTQFTPLWTHVSKLLATHASVGTGEAFWSCFSPTLTNANAANTSTANIVHSDEGAAVVAMETDDEEKDNDCISNEAKRLAYGQSSSNLERIDPLTYRLQLWKCLHRLQPQLVAKRTGVTSPLILGSLRDGEFCPSPNREPWIVRKRCQATLVAMLDLYANLGKTIKCVSSEAELHRWYYSLLQCSNIQVRKAALRCILAYGDKALAVKSTGASVDWLAFLNRLADYRSIKEALVSIGGDLTAANETQRQAVLAVAMRLLLGRVRCGGGVGGGSGGQLQCIFAFLEESCQLEERRNFLNQLLFEQYSAISLDNIAGIEITSDVSVGRLQASAKCALLVMSSMRLDQSDLCRIYSLFLCFCALLPRLAAELSGGRTANSQLRGLRQACQRGVLRALESGNDRQLTQRLIDDTFKHCVEPQLPRLATEAATASSPNLAIRLLQLWSADNRYDRLVEGQPIQVLASLLSNANASEQILIACLTVFNNLLSEDPTLSEVELFSNDPQYSTDSSNRKLSRPHFVAPVADNLANFVADRLSPGKLESLPDVSRDSLRLLALLVDNGLYRAEACEKLAAAILRLLLTPDGGGRAKKKRGQKGGGGGSGFLRGDEFQARLLAALLTLLRRADSPCRTLFLQAFTLFSKLSYRSSRILLCQIAEVAVTKLGVVNQPLGELANDLNAWDKRHVDMPDFTRRERGHQAALTVVRTAAGTSSSSAADNGWSGFIQRHLETMLIAEHCALHTLACISDGPLRLLASELLQSLVAALASLESLDSTNEARPRLLNMLLWKSIWPAIAQGVKMDETRRVEYIGLFGRIVADFGHHARLNGLAGLLPSQKQQQQQQQQQEEMQDYISLGTSTINDASFFDNVRSVNSARIVKGFRQLISYLASSRADSIPTNLLYNYLLPLPMHYLHSKRLGSSKQQQQVSRRSLVESSLELLAAISARLPWTMLKQLLKLCLKGLDGPATESKLPVRLAVAALSGLGEISDPTIVVNDQSETNKSELVNERFGLKRKFYQSTANRLATELLASNNSDSPLAFLTQFVCPRLERHLCRDKTASEQQHKLAPRQEPQVLQVTVAVALAQLLAKLPRQIRDQRLPRLIYRLADFLRSREHAVRKEAGATLVRVVQLLGNDYLGFVARELSLLLARGYTRHVLAHTLHALLRHCQSDGMPNGCLDGETLDRLFKIYMDELLGDLSKEKEVQALTRKLPEAQRTHAYNVVHRLGSVVGPTGLAQIVNNLADQCAQVRSSAALRKLERLCGQLERADSLPGNSGLTAEQLLTAAHMLCQRASSTAGPNDKASSHSAKTSGDNRRDPDCRLLDPEPARAETRPVQLGSYHILLRFGLRILYAVLRNNASASAASPVPRRMLDPFLTILEQALDSQHTAVLTASLQCLSRLVPLHQLLSSSEGKGVDNQNKPTNSAYKPIAKRVLKLFNEQSLLWSTRQQLQQPSQLQQLLHKTLAVLVRHDALSTPDLVTLIDYIALDVDSPHRASHAFPLLRAMLTKRLDPKPQRRHELDVDTERDHASLPTIMDALRRLAVTSALDYVRSQSRDCLLIYLRDYRLPAKTVRRYLDFFLVQLDYEGSDGRSSAVQMLAALIHCMSADWLLTGDLAAVIFFRLLVASDAELNDQLRARITDCMHGLLRRCGPDQRRQLFASTLRLIRCSVEQFAQRLTQQKLGLTGVLAFFEYRQDDGQSGVETADENWSTVELHNCLVELLDQLTNASSTDDNQLQDITAETKKKKSLLDAEQLAESVDHTLFRCVDLLGRCTVALEQFEQKVWPLLERLLGHRFSWIRRRCLQLVTNRLAKDIATADANESAIQHCRSLALAFFDQLKSAHLDEAWSDDVARALVHLCCRVHRLETSEISSSTLSAVGEAKSGLEKGFSSEWLLLRVGRESRYELQHLRPSTLRRRLALKVCAGVVTVLDADSLQSSGCLRRCLAVAARELRQREPPQEVSELAHALLDACRRTVGESAVAAALAQLTRSRSNARADRAGLLAAAAVTQPELFARRKRRKQQKKTEAAKAKVAKFRLARKGQKISN